MFTYIPIKESCRYVEIKLPKLISYQRKGNHSPWWPNLIGSRYSRMDIVKFVEDSH